MRKVGRSAEKRHELAPSHPHPRPKGHARQRNI
jgi:hypothetical protein